MGKGGFGEGERAKTGLSGLWSLLCEVGREKTLRPERRRAGSEPGPLAWVWHCLSGCRGGAQ